jgi:hypothetical protein
VSYEIVGKHPSNPWLWYSRVETCDVNVCNTYLATDVQLEQVVVEKADCSSLVLYSFAGRTGTIGIASNVPCVTAELPVPVDSTQVFISIVFLRADAEHEHWVVGVHGFVFTITTSENFAKLDAQLQSELRDQHFLKVDPLFYTFSSSCSIVKISVPNA